MRVPGYPGFDTLSPHAGAGPAATLPGTFPAAVPILEERIAALEAGVAGIAAASRQAALHLALATLGGAGSHVVASNAVSAGARRLLERTLPRFGIDTSFVDPHDAGAWRAAIRPATCVLFGAVVSDPAAGPAGSAMSVLDIPAVAALAHAHALPLLVDATLATPWLIQPFEHGADLALHAAPAYLAGRGPGAGGLLIDGGTFDWQRAWAQSGRFAALAEASEASTVGAFALCARRDALRDFGSAMGAHDAAAILQGLDTLGLRMARHVANAREAVQFLADHAAVETVDWPELDGHPDQSLARRLLPRGCGAVFSFRVRGGRAAAVRLVDALRLFAHGAGPGGAASGACTLPDADSADSAGIVRLSVGLEDAGDLIDDLGRALKASQKGA